MAGVDVPIVPPRPSPHPRPSGANLVVNALALAGIVGLGWFVVVQGRSLLNEFRSLREDQARTSRSAIVGYVDIHAEPNHARRPADWFHDEGDATLLWAGWRDGKHEWFRVARGDLEREQVSYPMGRDVVRAIDYPIIERTGGEHWVKVPDGAMVAGLWRNGVRAAYPLLVLSKVEVVNDHLGAEPVLVVFRPFAPQHESVTAFTPILDGRRITMGLSGYLMDRRPILYDRGTHSLWHDRDGTLRAIAGPLKGATLSAVAGIEVLAWSDYRSRYPESRLVVGADRKKPRPEL
jgi:hypothetical protein